MTEFSGEIAVFESPFARVLRGHMDARRSIKLHLIDDSVLYGIIVDVFDDGLATIDMGTYLMTFDIEKLVVVEVRKNGREQLDEQIAAQEKRQESGR